MKRTMIRVMLVNVDDQEALEIKKDIEKLVEDVEGATIEFTIAELPTLPPVVRTT